MVRSCRCTHSSKSEGNLHSSSIEEQRSNTFFPNVADNIEADGWIVTPSLLQNLNQVRPTKLWGVYTKLKIFNMTVEVEVVVAAEAVSKRKGNPKVDDAAEVGVAAVVADNVVVAVVVDNVGVVVVKIAQLVPENDLPLVSVAVHGT
ncbi:hypothetical protein Tco_0118006 [Tanacetum coccineum]